MADSPLTKLRTEIAFALATAMSLCKYDPKWLANTINMPKGFGDISCSVAFRISKVQPGDPNEIATNIVKRLTKNELIKSITIDNGYINFIIDRGKFTKATIAYAYAIHQKEPISDFGKKERVIIEYPSVNPNKPWHLGHLKNAVLGGAISKIHFASGYTVEREDYIDDLGAQVVESIWGYLNLNKEPGTKKFDQWLGEEYVKVNQEMEKRDIKEELSKLLQLIEQDGTYESKLAREISERCVRAQNETAFDYGIFRDVLIWETDIVATKQLDQAMKILEIKGVTKKPT